MKQEDAYWAALTRFRAFGPIRMRRLMHRFESASRIFEATITDLTEAGIEPEIANRFLKERLHMDPEKEGSLLERHGVHVITLRDEDYPKLLKEIYDPPAVLFYRGTLQEARHAMAVVGSRRASAYGIRATHVLTEPLAQFGKIIVSGLAVGIDEAAHEAAIQAQGITWGILGSGADEESIYPSRNRTLCSKILGSDGAIVSEFPIGTPPLKQHFPFRNRIIAGLCEGTLVVEAALKSGSLITARLALEANRDVYAVPGPIDSPLSEGPNQLIKMGATAVTCPEDLLGADIPPKRSASIKAYEPANSEEAAILHHLSLQPVHLDELIRTTNLPPQNVSSALTMMEMKGIARHAGGKFYTRSP